MLQNFHRNVNRCFESNEVWTCSICQLDALLWLVDFWHFDMLACNGLKRNRERIFPNEKCTLSSGFSRSSSKKALLREDMDEIMDIGIVNACRINSRKRNNFLSFALKQRRAILAVFLIARYRNSKKKKGEIYFATTFRTLKEKLSLFQQTANTEF